MSHHWLVDCAISLLDGIMHLFLDPGEFKWLIIVSSDCTAIDTWGNSKWVNSSGKIQVVSKHEQRYVTDPFCSIHYCQSKLEKSYVGLQKNKFTHHPTLLAIPHFLLPFPQVLLILASWGMQSFGILAGWIIDMGHSDVYTIPILLYNVN